MSKLPILGAKPGADSPSPEDEAFLNEERAISTPEFLRTLLEDKREEIAKMIVQDDRLVRSRDISGASAVQLAVYHGLDEMLGILLRSEITLELQEAAAVGQLERVQELIDQAAQSESTDAKLNEPGGDGFTALVLAATYGRTRTVHALLEAGAQVSLPARNPTRITPLHGASGLKNGDLSGEIVAALLEAGADVNAVQAGGFTALHRAAGAGHAAVVRQLLEAGADRDLESDLGITARELAEERGHIPVMALLAG